ncbi:hypothetical protein KJ608_04590 [Patescibacteria group bacterium]|nr:hypothetical protein [Patescibacteria group bacterium]
MRPSIPIAPKFKGGITITPSEYKDSKYYVKDIVTIKAKNVSDSNWGSGVEKVEFWLGRPGMPLNEDIDELIGTDNERELIMRDYSYVWDTTTVTSGEYTTYLKAYDQAGNSRISFGIPVVVSNVEGPNIIYISPADGENISNFWWSHVKALIEPIDSLHPIDLDSIELRLDGNIITHFTNNTNGYHMVSIFSTEDIGAIATSLPKGPHTFSIKVSDITGETSYKEWTLFVYHAKHLRPTQALNIRAKDIVYPINPNTCSMWIPQYYDEFYLNNYRDYNTQEQRFCYYVYRNFVSFDASVIVDNISKATLLIEGFFNNAPFDIEIWTSDWDYDIRRSWDSNISFVGKFNKDDVYNDYYYYIQIDPSVVTKAGETKFMFIASPELLLNSYVYMNGSGYMAQLIIDDPNYFDK